MALHKKSAEELEKEEAPRSRVRKKDKLIDVLGSSAESKRARVTFLLPAVLDRNIELFCLQRGLKKSDVAETAFIDYLTGAGMKDPADDRSAELERIVNKGKLN